jgi:hypothetical protein
LAIISNKPIGTKLRIDNNVIYLQEPGPFQALSRYFYKSNKTNIQYLYNPIEMACNHYLTKEFIQKNPKTPIIENAVLEKLGFEIEDIDALREEIFEKTDIVISALK